MSREFQTLSPVAEQGIFFHGALNAEPNAELRGGGASRARSSASADPPDVPSGIRRGRRRRRRDPRQEQHEQQRQWRGK